MGDAVFIFYGSSGDKLTRDPPSDEDMWKADVQSYSNADSNKSYQRAAETLGATIKRTWPSYDISIEATWTHEVMLNALANSKSRIQQVHVFSHGASSGLSLAYKFPNKTAKRLNAQAAVYWSEVPLYAWSKEVIVDRALAREDGLVAGRLSRYGWEHYVKTEGRAGTIAKQVEATAKLTAIRGLLAEGAYIQLWNCYSGSPDANYFIGGSGYHSITVEYRARLHAAIKEQAGAGPANQDKPGIAREMAKVFGVPCTAAKRIKENEDAGTLFFHRDSKGAIQTEAKGAPSWMWTHPNAQWLTYGSNGDDLTAKGSGVLMLGKWRDVADVRSAALSGGADSKSWKVKTPPPKWLTDAYDKAKLI